MNSLLEAALHYAALGYKVFPCVPGQKVPLTPHGFLDATTDPAQIEAWWTKCPDANVGMSTEGLVVIDVDGADNPWPADADKARDLARAPISLTPHGGRHYIFRQPEGKDWRNTTGKIAPRVDTRANGGYVLLPPSEVDGKPYRWAPPTDLASPENLAEPGDGAAASLAALGGNGMAPGPRRVADRAAQGADPAEEDSLIPTGQRNATLARLAGVMRRVGMGRDEILGGLERVNVGRCRPPLSAREVERIAASISRYEPDQVSVAVVENHWAQDADAAESVADAEATPDPGLMPDDLFRVPGFVSEVMDHCLMTAPYPNQVIAFAGALALQAVLAGRKVRDRSGIRTNLYLLGLAYSASGKEHPRKLNVEIMDAIGLSNQIGGTFASGEGLQDALFTDPCKLYQTDEIDGMLQSINKAKDARHENLMGTMLTMHSAAQSIFPMRCKAGNPNPGIIVQPCLVVLGTAIPNHYYEALSERMLTNGFFSRTITLQCGTRSTGQDAPELPPPARVLETAKWWSEFRPSSGDLYLWHPSPKVVPQTAEAAEVLTQMRLEAESEYARAETRGDAVATTVWGRASEHARRLALLYAVSENHVYPEVGKGAAEWARRFILHQTRLMLFMASSHVAENPFQADCLKAMRKLRSVPGGELAHSILLKRMKMDTKAFQLVMGTLEQRGEVVVRTQATSGRTGRYYGLA